MEKYNEMHTFKNILYNGILSKHYNVFQCFSMTRFQGNSIRKLNIEKKFIVRMAQIIIE